jgi:hypothetical protein
MRSKGLVKQIEDKYNKFNIKHLDLDWCKIERIYGEIGNVPGIYPEVGTLFYHIGQQEEVETIVEFGSGASTLYWEAIAKKFGKKFVSYEDDKKYLDMTMQLCNEFSYNPTILEYKWNKLQDDLTGALGGEPDVIFLDSNNRTRVFSKLYYTIFHAKWFLVDDAQQVSIKTFFTGDLTFGDRFNFYHYQPVCRGDRTVLINHKDNDFQLDNWINEWLM